MRGKLRGGLKVLSPSLLRRPWLHSAHRIPRSQVVEDRKIAPITLADPVKQAVVEAQVQRKEVESAVLKVTGRGQE
jgi:hypothetical protein